MDKKRIICLILAVLLVGLVGLKFYMSTKDIQDSSKISADEKKFKEEYESLNDTSEYQVVKIEEDNNVVYKSASEIVDIMKKETSVIYFGMADNNDCRQIVETLISSVKDNNMGRIYYVDVKEIDEEFEQEILTILGDNYETDILNVPMVIGISEGDILGIHVGSIENAQDTLNDSDKKELYKIYNSVIQAILDTSCGQEQEQGC